MLAADQRASSRFSRPAKSAIAANSAAGTDGAVRPAGQAENVERLIEPGFVLEEVGVGGETKPQRRRGRRIGRHRVGDAAQVCGLGRLGREITQVPADRRDLPGEPFLRLHTLESGQQPVDQTRDDVSAQREPRRMLTIVLALDPGPLQERSVRQDIRRRPELVEELLGREQSVNPSAVIGSEQR